MALAGLRGIVQFTVSMLAAGYFTILGPQYFNPPAPPPHLFLSLLLTHLKKKLKNGLTVSLSVSPSPLVVSFSLFLTHPLFL